MKKELDKFLSEMIVTKKTTQEWVTDILRELILRGYFEEDRFLDTTEIADKLNVSRMPVRIALIQLEREGLVTLQPHKKAVTTKLSPKEVRQLRDIRCELEALAIRLAIHHITEEDIQYLDELILKMDNCKDINEFISLNNEFHNRIYMRSGNDELQNLIIQFRNKVERYLRIYVSDYANLKSGNKEHREILQTIKNRDIKEADRIIRVHLTNTCEVVAGILESFKSK